MLGDAGEHYAVSQFTFAHKPATKMPDGWKGYDLAVESGTGLVRVSVKTRSEGDSWKGNRWFNFDSSIECDWIVFIFLSKDRDIRAWVIPYDVAKAHSNTPGPTRKDPHFRDLSWKKLIKLPLAQYENNWDLFR